MPGGDDRLLSRNHPDERRNRAVSLATEKIPTDLPSRSGTAFLPPLKFAERLNLEGLSKAQCVQEYQCAAHRSGTGVTSAWYFR